MRNLRKPKVIPARAVAAIAIRPPFRNPFPTAVPPAAFVFGLPLEGLAALGEAALRAGAARGFGAAGGLGFGVTAFSVAAFDGAAVLAAGLRVAPVLRGAAGLRTVDGLRVEPAPRRAGVFGGGGVALLGGVGGVVSSVISAP